MNEGVAIALQVSGLIALGSVLIHVPLYFLFVREE